MARPLRFCMVTTFYPPYNFGGDGIFVERLAHELVDRGHQVDVVHCTDAYRAVAPIASRPAPADDPKITVHRLASPFGRLSPLATQQTGYPLFKTSRLKAILERGFDVIHFHNISLVGGPGVLALGRGIKLYTLHEYWLICPTHILFKFDREVCTSRACVACQLAYRRPPQLWRSTGLMAAAIAHVDAFISPDHHTIGKHREIFPSMPLVHLPHFVPEEDLASRDAERPPNFLFVGRLERLKGLQTILPIFRDYPHAALWIAGTGRQEAELRTLAAGSPNIRFLGHQSGQALRDLYRHAIAVIVPSINYEVAPPLVIMEAFRQQTPALVPNLGSMPEIIAESAAGFVYNDAVELRAALDRLAGNRPLRDELGLRGYRTYRERWTADAHLSAYFSLIRTQAERRGISVE